MQALPEDPLRALDDVARFEAALPLEKRLPGRSIYYVFVAAAERDPKATAITMVMTGAPDEQPRRIHYAQLLSLVRRPRATWVTYRARAGHFRTAETRAHRLIRTHGI